MSCPICKASLFQFKMDEDKVTIVNDEIYSCEKDHVQCKKCNKQFREFCQACLGPTHPLYVRVKEGVEWDEEEFKQKLLKTKAESEVGLKFFLNENLRQNNSTTQTENEFVEEISDIDFFEDKMLLRKSSRSEKDESIPLSEEKIATILKLSNKNIGDMQQYYADVTVKLRRVVNSLKRRKMLIPPNALKVPKTLMPCPDDFCHYVGEIPLFNEHLNKCHQFLPKTTMAPGETASFALDPKNVIHNVGRAFIIYEIKGILQPVKENPYIGYLPIVLMGTRIKIPDIGEKNVLLWLGGPVFHNFPLTATLKIFRDDKLPLQKSSTCYLRSLYESPNPMHIMQSGHGILLSDRELRKFTKHDRDFLHISVEVNW